MKNGVRYFIALAVCSVIFALWILVWKYFGKSVITGIIFVIAINRVCIAIIGKGGSNDNSAKEDCMKEDNSMEVTTNDSASNNEVEY